VLSYFNPPDQKEVASDKLFAGPRPQRFTFAKLIDGP
jgi:hypothetical protein